MIRYTVNFSGHVQGVGFRYTTRSVASNYKVAGYVRNLPDGKVLLVAEGQKEELDEFLGSLNNRMSNFIRSQTLDKSPATLQFGHPDNSPLTIMH